MSLLAVIANGGNQVVTSGHAGQTLIGSMTSPVYTFVNGDSISAGGTLSWDAPENWSPSTISYQHFDIYGGGGYTTENDSMLFGNIGIGRYTATFADQGFDDAFDPIDQVDTLTLNYSGATISQTQGGALYVGGGINELAGTIDLAVDGAILFEPAAAGPFVINGVLEGSGFIGGGNNLTLTGTGTIIAVAHSDGPRLYPELQIQNQIGAGLTMQIDSGATLAVDGVAAGDVLTIENSSTGALDLYAPMQFHGTVAGLAVGHGRNVNPGSFIELDSTSFNVSGITQGLYNATLSNNVITLEAYVSYQIDNTTTSYFENLGTIQLAGNYTGDHINWVDGVGDHNYDTWLWVSDAVCYTAGTMILTPDGEVPVEHIKVGDRVTVAENGRTRTELVTWTGRRRIELARHRNGAELAPIRFRRGALGDGLPTRDLLVSPPHGMYFGGRLIPAKLLVNGMSVIRDETVAIADYYHLELGHHSLLIANGVMAESYLDTGNRSFFGNPGVTTALNPDLTIDAPGRMAAAGACAPLEVRPEEVEPVWRGIANRAAARGLVPPAFETTDDAGIHLLADGRRLDASAVTGTEYWFVVPAGTRTLMLASRSVVPSRLTPWRDDPRQLGVSVRSITIGDTVIAADHPALTDGWHAAERYATWLWRWTDGRGTIPAGVLRQATMVRVQVAETARYIIAAANRAAA